MVEKAIEQNRNVSNNKILIFLSFVFYKILLDIGYYFLISKFFSYEGFYLNFNIFKYIESWTLICLVIFLFILFRYKTIHKLFLLILIVNMYIPTLVVYAMRSGSRTSIYVFSIVVLFTLWALGLFYKAKSPIKQIKYSKYALRFGLFCIAAIIIALVIKEFKGFNFNLLKVYSIRAGYAKTFPHFFYYLIDWGFNITVPFLACYFYLERKYLYFTIIIFLWLALFSITGLKSVLFSLPFIALVLFLIKLKKVKLLYPAVHSLGIVIATSIYYFTHNLLVASIFVRRYLLLPALNYFNYVDFFSSHPKLMLSHSIFKGFLPYKYFLSPPHLIGYYYYGQPEMNANAGFIADAFANFGYIGIFLFSLLLIIILVFIGFITSKKNKYLIASLFLMPFISLSNSSLLTTLLTHGLLFAMFLAFLLEKEAKT